MKLRLTFTTCAVLAALAAASHAQDAPPAGGRLIDGKMQAETFADANLVARMATLLGDPDPLVREKVTLDLGESHNPLARPRIEAMAADASPAVRVAAVRAAIELDANTGVATAVKALADADRAVVTSTLAMLRPFGDRADAVAAVAALTGNKDAAIACAAVETLTHWGRPAEAGRLAEMLRGGTLLRLRAAQNAVFLKDGSALAAELTKAAAEDVPGVRAEALVALVAIAPAAAGPLAPQAAKSDEPLLRRGAALAWGKLGQADPIAPLLDDPSPMVQLAAVRAAGEAKATALAARLIEIMLSHADEPMHLAAREALLALGAAAPAERLGEALAAAVKDLQDGRLPAGLAVQPSPLKATRLLERNVRSLSWLLGRLKAPAAAQRTALAALPPDSRALLDVLPSLAACGDPAAGPPLREMLSATVGRGEKALLANLRKQPVKDYDDEVAGALIDAVAAMNDANAVGDFVRIIRVDVQGDRLVIPSAAAARALGKLAKADAGPVDSALRAILADARFGRAAQYEAAVAAGRLKIASAGDELRRLLAAGDSWPVMRAAAWALAQIGQPVADLGEPRLNQKGAGWTVKSVETER